jgi:hypothetical protein
MLGFYCFLLSLRLLENSAAHITIFRKMLFVKIAVTPANNVPDIIAVVDAKK